MYLSDPDKLIFFGCINYFHYIGMYEVLATEPLHDVRENISNIITEISAHLLDVM